MTRSLASLFLAPLVALALAAPPAAQCQLHDNLDGGPCCALTQAQIPSFQNFKQDALRICWQDCGIDQVALVQGRWFNLNVLPGTTPPPCGERRMRLDIVQVPNTLLWRGTMRLQYARTWVVVDTSGALLQVWRFLVNGDLTNYPAAGAAPCPVPACAPAFGNRTRFTGYVDFVEDCSIAGGSLQYSWMLTHACDAFDHQVGFPRGGTYHPDRSFSFVAPAAGFVPGPFQPFEGTTGSPFESLRQRVATPAPSSIACTFEDPAFHTLTPQNLGCACGLPGTNQFMIGDLAVQTACGNAVRNPPGGPFVPGYVSMGIGSWTLPNIYPGQQSVRWTVGAYDVFDACAGTVQYQIFYGATTFGGFPALQLVGGTPAGPLPPFFLDQGSSQTPAGAMTMNGPYTSYHFLHLNH